MDTIDTDDKFIKIVLYDNHSWDYYDIGRPVIDSSNMFDAYWNTTVLHAYKDYPSNLIPEEVDLRLVDSLHGYCPPITGVVRSGYQFRRTREHQGIDIPLHTGDTIRAAFDGVVRYIGYTRETGGYGNLVIIRHPNGLETYYGHLS
ncbi:MAG: M23 family metallopeptidase, partial [Bacteroidales bacterium]|nr:M23 family metallopeptidase [Bacteroidales bacterium]